MKFQHIGMALFVVVLLAMGMAGCDELWSLDTSQPVQITSSTNILVTAEGSDPLDARTQVEQLLVKRKFRVNTTGDINRDTLRLIISYEYLPENEFCRNFKLVLQDAKGTFIKSGQHLGEKSLHDLLIDLDTFLLGDSLFIKK